MKPTKTELEEILRKHKLWLNGKEGGERMDLSGAKLDYEIEDGLLKKIAQIIWRPRTLHNGNFNTFETTYKIKELACALAKNGKKLKKKYGVHIAALLLLGPEVNNYFYENNEKCAQWLKTKL